MLAEAPNLTRTLVQQALSITYDELPARALTLAQQCLLDWLAVTLGGHDTPLVATLLADLREQGGPPQATVFGGRARLPVYAAALLNGTASHALDYDDVNYAMTGHPTVPVMPALLALAEHREKGGDAVIAAFVAGYEFECRVGLAVAPGHYARGFHATATIGALGAAMACAHLLGLSEDDAAHAIGIAATQAAGLKAMFGTDCKPMHAGNAARIGVQAANLAARGFGSRLDSLECPQGFAAVHGPDLNAASALAAPADGFHLYANLFKFHAACYETHATIEACQGLRESFGLTPAEVSAVSVRVNPYCDRICNIQAPQTGLEAKFSLRQTAAFALAGLDTGAANTYSTAVVTRPDLQSVREKVTVVLDAGVAPSQACVRLSTVRGEHLERDFDASRPQQDLAAQERRLRAKADSLLSPVLSVPQRQALFELIPRIAEPGQFQALLKVFRAG